MLATDSYYSYPKAQALADLDGDGDLDLVASVLGPNSANEPTRMFLNDGGGFFAEFNPSDIKLSAVTIATGQLGL